MVSSVCNQEWRLLGKLLSKGHWRAYIPLSSVNCVPVHVGIGSVQCPEELQATMLDPFKAKPSEQ